MNNYKPKDISNSPRESTNGIMHANGFTKYHDMSGKYRKHVFIKGTERLVFSNVGATNDYINSERLL